MPESLPPIPVESVASRIFFVRGQKVMLDSDPAELYGVNTSALNQAVKRNKERFPADFMFQVTDSEYINLKSQFVTSSWGGRRKLPWPLPNTARSWPRRS